MSSPFPTSVTVADLSDPLPLARALIGRESVTPVDAGALDVLAGALESLGFVCHRLTFTEEGTDPVENLFARLGTEGPCFGYAGHTDVVPPGEGWSKAEPFSGAVVNGDLVGRGAADMKGGIACFVAAVARLVEERGAPKGSIAFLITGDEEGPAINGTRKVLDWMGETGERMDLCLVGEPTNPEGLGDMIKIGRRGSINATIVLKGRQGHVAYPHLADNPMHRLSRLTGLLLETPLDDGTDHFQPSSLQLTSIDVGNKAANLIPGQATLTLNIRFNDLHSGADLAKMLREKCLEVCDGDESLFELSPVISGESFLTPPGLLSDLISKACVAVTGREPELSTSGGTSDARFIKDHCPVAEFGLVGQTMHKVDERVPVTDLEGLTDIYLHILMSYFGESRS